MAGSPRPPNPTSSSTPSATRCGTRPSPAAPARCDAGLAPLPHCGRGRGPSRQGWEGEGLSVATTLTRLATLATLSCGAGEGLFFLWLQRLQHCVGAGHLDLAGHLLDIERLHGAVLDQHRIALRADTETGPTQVDVEPDRAGEVAAAVGQHHDLVADILRLAPGTHHRLVVDRNAGDRVDALGLEIGSLFDKARHMALRTGRGEGARHREQHHLLATEELFGADVLGAFRGHEFQRPRRYLVANLDGHRMVPPNLVPLHDRAGAAGGMGSATDSIAGRTR